MPTPDTNGVPPFADFDDVKRKMNEIVQKYNNLLVNLDSLNVVSLTADHIDAGTINADIVTIKADYASGAFIEIGPNGMRINDGTKDTFSVDTDGNVVMTSAIVQSAVGYPKVVMDPDNNLFGAYKDANNYLEVTPELNGSPGMYFNVSGSVASGMFADSGQFNIGATARDLRIETSVQGNIYISPELNYNVFFPNGFISVYGAAGENLANELFSKADRSYTDSTLASNMNFDPGTRNLKLFAPNGTTIATVNIP